MALGRRLARALGDEVPAMRLCRWHCLWPVAQRCACVWLRSGERCAPSALPARIDTEAGLRHRDGLLRTLGCVATRSLETRAGVRLAGSVGCARDEVHLAPSRS